MPPQPQAPNTTQWTLHEVAYVMEKALGHRVTVRDIKIMLGRVMVQEQIADCLRTYFDLPEPEEV